MNWYLWVIFFILNAEYLNIGILITHFRGSIIAKANIYMYNFRTIQYNFSKQYFPNIALAIWLRIFSCKYQIALVSYLQAKIISQNGKNY